jgi:hypothetical protein
VGDLFEREERYAELPGDYDAVAAYVAARAPRPVDGRAARQPAAGGRGWADYGLVDSGHGRKLERYGAHRFIRPEPQALWPRAKAIGRRMANCARRDEDGGGAGAIPAARRGLAAGWGDVRFTAQCTLSAIWAFSRYGMAPVGLDGADAGGQGCRHAQPVRLYRRWHAGAQRIRPGAWTPAEIGGAGAPMPLSGMEARPIRWIIDDAAKFTAREGRRGKRYDGIIWTRPVRPRARGRSGGWKSICPAWCAMRGAAGCRQPVPVPHRLCGAHVLAGAWPGC